MQACPALATAHTPIDINVFASNLRARENKVFVVEVKVGSLVARGEGSSKKEAQQQAAKYALEMSSRA